MLYHVGGENHVEAFVGKRHGADVPVLDRPEPFRFAKANRVEAHVEPAHPSISEISQEAEVRSRAGSHVQRPAIGRNARTRQLAAEEPTAADEPPVAFLDNRLYGIGRRPHESS